MTVSTESNKVFYDGNGVATTFPYAFKIFENADLVVIKTDTEGVDTTLVLDSDYSVSGAGDDTGGNVTYPLSGDLLATGEQLTIVREIDYLQETDLRNQGAWNPEVVEDEFDREVMMSQQLNEQASRALHFNVTEDRSSNTNLIPTPVAGNVLGWGDTGDLENVDFSISVSDQPTVNTIAQLRNVDVTVSTNAYVLGTLAIGDGGQGHFYYSALSTQVDNGVSVVEPSVGGGRWLLQNNANDSIYTATASGDVNALEVTITPDPFDTLISQKRVFFIENTLGPCTIDNPTISFNGAASLGLRRGNLTGTYAGDTGPQGYIMILELRSNETAVHILNPYMVNGASIVNGSIPTDAYANDSITTGKVANSNITFAKTQNIATARMLGRNTAGSGVIEELTATTARSVMGLGGFATLNSFVGAAGAESIDLVIPVSAGGSIRVTGRRVQSTTTASQTFTFPTAFSSTPLVFCQRLGAGIEFLVGPEDTVTSTAFQVDKDNTLGNLYFYYLAIGPA